MTNPVWPNMLRVRAWYAIFQVAQAAAEAKSLYVLRQLLCEALEAVQKAEEAESAK